MRSISGSILRLGDKHYRVRVTAGYDPDTGKQVRASRTIRGTRKDAEELKNRLLREYGSADAVIYGRMSVYHFVRDEWLATRHIRQTTRQGYESTLENHIRPHFESVRMRDLRPLTVARAIDSIEHRGAALNAYKMLRSALNLAVRNDALPSNPVLRVDPPRTEAYHAEVYSLPEIIAMLEHARGSDVEAGLIIAACCGTRASETCALDWGDVTLARGDIARDEPPRGAVDVSKSYHALSGSRVMAPTKTERSRRVVALPAFAVARLLEIRGDGRIGPVLVDAKGERMTPVGFSHRWRRLMLPREGYEPPVRYIPLKNLRHSRATTLLDLGAPMRDVSLSLGHVNERTTSSFYDRPEMRADHGNAALLDRAAQGLRGAKSSRNTPDGRTAAGAD